MTITTVTGKRQITIPADIARDLGVETGSQIEWTEASAKHRIILTIRLSRREQWDRLHAIGRKYKNIGADSSALLNAIRDEEDVASYGAMRVAETSEIYTVRKPRRRK